MTTLDICAPADQTEGTRSQILRWLKTVGDTVTEHEPLIELETDKVTVEVPAPASGVLREIVKAEQEEIAPGEVLGRLETAEGASAMGGSAGARRERANDANESAARSGGSTTAVGAGAVDGGPATAGDGGARSRAERLLSPAVRRLLQERGLEPSMIRGTGEGGRITVDDVAAYDVARQADEKAPTIRTERADAAATAARAKQTSGEPSAHPSPTAQSSRTTHAKEGTRPRPPEPLSQAGGRSHSIPHTAVRKRIADHMVQSLLHTAPHVTTVFEADLSAVIAHRSAHRADFQQRGVPLTFTAYFLAAAVNAIKAVPEANSRWTDTALEVYDDIHLGVATAVEGLGLVVPVVRNVQSLDLFGIASRLDQLVSAAREQRLEPADVRGGTFTISNHGVSGSLLATPIVINQPQSAILGIGKLEKRPVIVEAGEEEKILVRPKCYVTLTIDHRVMDGHQANRFLQTFVSSLEAWPLDV